MLLLKLLWDKVQFISNMMYLYTPTAIDSQLDSMREIIARNKIRVEYCAANTDAVIAKLQAKELDKKMYNKMPGIDDFRDDAETFAKIKAANAEELKQMLGDLISQGTTKMMATGTTPG